MTRKLTQIGIAAPAQVNRRPSGRYSVQAPDAPAGSVLRVVTQDGVSYFVELVVNGEERLFLDIERNELEFTDWDYATRDQVEAFRAAQRIASTTDDVDLGGVPATFGKKSSPSVPPSGRRALMVAVAEELRSRGKRGKASQVLAYLTAEDQGD